jgi:hypothetical protein
MAAQVPEREYGSSKRPGVPESASPLTHIDQVGRCSSSFTDERPRVPVSRARQIHQALFEREILRDGDYDDEGHGLMKLKNRLDAYEGGHVSRSRATPGSCRSRSAK